MQNKLLIEYAVLDKQIKALEEEKSLLRELIVADFKKSNLEKVESEYGLFTIGKKINWSYSSKIKALEDKVKIAKDKEQKKGIAESSITEYLLFKGIK